jgi:hydroxymethylpyrimidine/phosphomethylpyrimidine kinase
VTVSRSRRALTIAGSDSGGGAGIQADLKTFAAHGVYGMSAVTALTAQNTLGVLDVHVPPASLVAAQIDAVFDDLAPDVVKIGMLATAEIVETVTVTLANRVGPPVVLDPVMIAASGDPLLAPDAVEAIRARLAPLATVLTPNLPEAERLANGSAGTLADRRRLARELGRLGGAVLLKGGHAEGEEIVDLLWDGADLHELRHPRLRTPAGHGTGCSLASAVAARLARGESLVDACRGAVEWLAGALAAAEQIGSGASPVDHFWLLRSTGRFA